MLLSQTDTITRNNLGKVVFVFQVTAHHWKEAKAGIQDGNFRWRLQNTAYWLARLPFS